MGFQKFLRDFQDHVVYVTHIFNLFLEDPSDKTIRKKLILDQFKRTGILFDDPRIQRMMVYFEEKCEDDIDLI